jgi:hypothetical protein
LHRQGTEVNSTSTQGRISQNLLDGTQSLSHSFSLPVLHSSASENKALRMRAVRPLHRLSVDELHRSALAAPSVVLANSSLNGKSLSTLGMLNSVLPPAIAMTPCAPPSKEFSIRDLLLPGSDG